MRKTIYLLNVDGYAPEITSLTYPLISFYAEKIDAEIHHITERKFPGFPVTYEKLQIFEIARNREDEWIIYIDSDALIHPETIDFTNFIPRDTVCHHGADMANLRWKYDDYFKRDGRNFGSCNWFTIASSWCLDLWRPFEDITLAEALANIYPTVGEVNTIITREHLIDDYALSRNIARFGLKATTILELQPKIGLPEGHFFWHAYLDPPDKKVELMIDVLARWQITPKIVGSGAFSRETWNRIRYRVGQLGSQVHTDRKNASGTY